MGPVFLFGTGRCGSTHLQRLVSLNTAVWVWGEHDGFLRPLLRGLKEYESSPMMKRFVFDAPPPEDDAALVARVQGETGMLSWLNRLDPDSLRAALRTAIETMFARRLPRGWTGWGFKEVRYGGQDDVPAQLLDLFPACRAAFSFREPAATLASMLNTWTPALVREPGKLGEIPAAYEYQAKKWLACMRYFVALKQARPDRIVLLDTDTLGAPTGAVLDALGLPRRGDAPSRPTHPTNRGPAQRFDSAAQMMAACFEGWRDEMADIYDTARTLRARL